MTRTDEMIRSTLKELDEHAAKAEGELHTTVAMAVKALCLALKDVSNAIREAPDRA